MKSFDSFVQGLITFAIMGVGVLIGLAMAVVVNGLDIGGVAPLFANAIGAAIGAAITLWTIEKRNQKASIETAKKNLTIAVADLSIIIVHARAIQTGLATGDIDNLVTNAVRVLNDALSHPRQILDVLLEAQFSEDYGALIVSFGNVQRILSELPRERSELTAFLKAQSSDLLPDFEFLETTVQSTYDNLRQISKRTTARPADPLRT